LTPPPIIEVESIHTVPTTSAQRPAANQPQIEQPLQDPETTIGVVPGSTSTTQGLKRGEINWNGTFWEGDTFDDDEDMKEVRRAILMLNQSFTVSNYPRVE
jgi:hypothetical protein